MYAVILFIYEDEEDEVVPMSWLYAKKAKCRWPPFKRHMRRRGRSAGRRRETSLLIWQQRMTIRRENPVFLHTGFSQVINLIVGTVPAAKKCQTSKECATCSTSSTTTPCFYQGCGAVHPAHLHTKAGEADHPTPPDPGQSAGDGSRTTGEHPRIWIASGDRSGGGESGDTAQNRDMGKSLISVLSSSSVQFGRIWGEGHHRQINGGHLHKLPWLPVQLARQRGKERPGGAVTCQSHQRCCQTTKCERSRSRGRHQERLKHASDRDGGCKQKGGEDVEEGARLSSTFQPA